MARSPLAEGRWQRPGSGDLRPQKQRPRVSVAAWSSWGPDRQGVGTGRTDSTSITLEARGCVGGTFGKFLLLFT